MPAATEEYANPYAARAGNGFPSLIDAVLKEEFALSRTLLGADLTYVKNLAREVLKLTNGSVLDAILRGNIAWMHRTDPKVKKALDVLWSRREIQPSIYMQVLVDKDGLSPSPSELVALIDRLREYCKTDGDPVLAHHVDNYKTRTWHTLESSRSGKRKYLTKPGTAIQSKRRVMEVLTFYDNLEARLRKTSGWAKPLDMPLVEFGYTHNAEQRLRAHRNHQQSNYLMNLTEAVCARIY